MHQRNHTFFSGTFSLCQPPPLKPFTHTHITNHSLTDISKIVGMGKQRYRHRDRQHAGAGECAIVLLCVYARARACKCVCVCVCVCVCLHMFVFAFGKHLSRVCSFVRIFCWSFLRLQDFAKQVHEFLKQTGMCACLCAPTSVCVCDWEDCIHLFSLQFKPKIIESTFRHCSLKLSTYLLCQFIFKGHTCTLTYACLFLNQFTLTGSTEDVHSVGMSMHCCHLHTKEHIEKYMRTKTGHTHKFYHFLD